MYEINRKYKHSKISLLNFMKNYEKKWMNFHDENLRYFKGSKK